ncbi:phosphoribosyl transferase [Streptomyces bungoensis]|uniref:Phosphoribosyl transferase n=1 Tax=Streptomyces bungoensis TaxID=285568 RepID=A0A101SVC2_9ACTN|nr:phosphoribosyltransferase family protein [Streptomyces bungoensis]KUN80603.1 phosphoribosyl transferase [Streptomyces bungoensis]
MFFVDRHEAGRRLAGRLKHLRGADLVVLGLPRGGVPVAAEVARALGAPLDVCLVRKLGVPFQPELAMGAVGEGGVRVINDEVVRAAGITARELAEAEAREEAVVESRARHYRGGRPPVGLEGRTVLVVDDGVATGATARTACRIARARGAARIVLAVPVAPHDWAERLGEDADGLVCLHAPRHFSAVGRFYPAGSSPIDDDEVVACLEEAVVHPVSTRRAPSGHTLPVGREVDVPAGAALLHGRLTVPDRAFGVVVFTPGGSGRDSPRDRYVAEGLNRAGFVTLLLDPLTEEEEADRAGAFDTAGPARRLADATGRLRDEPGCRGLAVGYFGTGTGAAAALRAAAEPDARIAAVVCRGGRPDLAGPRLPAVAAPTLLIAGGHDRQALGHHREALARLRCEHALAIVPGATHLFEEPGALRKVTDLARDWFFDHMPAPAVPATAAHPAHRRRRHTV